MILLRILLISVPVLVTGCWVVPEVGPEKPPSFDWSSVEPAGEQRAVDRALSVDRSTFDEAWADLERFGYTQDRAVVVRDEHGDVMGRATRSISVGGTSNERSVRIVSSDSSGSFEHSFWSRFSESDSADSGDWPSLILPEDPVFLASQGPAYFRYASLPDTVIGDQVVGVVLTEARPETSRHGIQQAKLYLDGDTLVGLEIFFLQQSLLYRELTTSKIFLTPRGDNTWLPSLLRVRSTVGLPFKRARTYELTSDFGNFKSL